MADIGTLATDREYCAMIPEFKKVGDIETYSQESIIIRGCEAAIRNYVKFPAVDETIENEEHSIAWPTVQDDIIVNRQDSFLLRRSPLKSFESLLIVTSRSATDGSVTATTEIPRDGYHVELSTGIVRELSWTLLQGYLLQLYPGFRFPAGTMILLANYVASTSDADVLMELKLVAIMFVARIYKQFKKNNFGVSSTSFDGGSVQYMDCHLSEQEKGHLNTLRPKRGIFPSFR